MLENSGGALPFGKYVVGTCWRSSTVQTTDRACVGGGVRDGATWRRAMKIWTVFGKEIANPEGANEPLPPKEAL